MSTWDSVKSFITNTPDPTTKAARDQDLFIKSTDQLPPEALGYSLDSNAPNHSQQQQQQHQQQQQQQQQRSHLQQFQQPPALRPMQMDSSHTISNSTNINTSAISNSATTNDKTGPARRIHFDSIQESKDLIYDISKGPRPLLVQPHETRTNADFASYFNDTIDAFERQNPGKPLPKLSFNIEPIAGKPFLCENTATEANITPLALAVSQPLLRKMFRILTPTFHEDGDKLIQVTDSLYFTPNRCKFLLAKALSEASLGALSPLTEIKLEFLKWFPKRYPAARVEKEVRSDTMAAHYGLPFALGGLEHATKLHHVFTLYKYDMQPDNDALFAADRFLNLLEVIEDKYGLAPIDALIQALPPDAFLTDNPKHVIQAANDILDSKQLTPVNTFETPTKHSPSQENQSFPPRTTPITNSQQYIV